MEYGVVTMLLNYFFSKGHAYSKNIYENIDFFNEVLDLIR